MKKIIMLAILFICSVTISESTGLPQNSMQIDKIRLIESDIPNGFIFGIIPEGAKQIFKSNPWLLDKDAIKLLTDKIYPDGDFNNIAAIHMTILAKSDTPHGDDIVCYIIQYKNSIAAKTEAGKLSEFLKYQGDRVITNIKDNFAVLFLVDDIKDFHFIEELDKKIKERINSL